MGAIWDFISGKSTDWDAMEERQKEYEQAHPRQRRIHYKAYCKYCGVSTEDRDGYTIDELNFGRRSPENAVRVLQRRDKGCGRGNHTPVIQEI